MGKSKVQVVVKVAELENLKETLEGKLANLESSNTTSNIGIYKGIMRKLIEDLSNLVCVAEAQELSDMPLNHSVANNIHKNIQSLHDDLQYNDPAILNFLENEEILAINPQKVENFEEDLTVSHFSGVLKPRSFTASKIEKPVVNEGEEDWDLELKTEEEGKEANTIRPQKQ
ncbi:Uncharacterised protein [Legionella busanensis]|uniref:Uncharacterized protein n=1 Tax=Legionella busanensis TaxID=190655 RepID=A0A378JJV2_9GAMM|nr:hypothetical protein [Legionella busanensis]STX51021.1 Uncharacterised protein [Legionella busanensis]